MSAPGTLMLAIFGSQRRPRVVKPSAQRYARAWARRWWLVEAASADDARTVIVHSETEPLLGVPQRQTPGRILDTGRNARGGPKELPRASSRGTVEGSGER